MSYSEIQLWLDSIEVPEAKYLIAVQYATGCRIGELIQYTHKNGVETKGLRFERIQEFPGFWRLIFPVFKLRKISYEPCYVSKNEKWLIDILVPLFKFKEFGAVFNFRDSKARKLIKREFFKLAEIMNIHDQKSNVVNKTFSSHNLRATRITHLLNPPINMNLIEAQKHVRVKRLDTIKEYYNENFVDRLNKFKLD